MLHVPLEQTVLHPAIALAYLAAVSLAFRSLKDVISRLPAPGPILLALALGGYMVVPALAVRTPVVVPALAIGWEAMLSAYSYCRETRGKQSSAEDCLVFILVNPSLVYLERGQRIESADIEWSGALRCAFGLTTWIAQASLALALAPFLAGRNPTLGNQGYVGFMLLYAGNALAMYWAHSGLASVQIGLMRIAGWRIPERYMYPFLATSPADFWRRWNAYVGSWARRYAFVPWALSLGRSRHVGRQTAKALALLGTFMLIGTLHASMSFASAAVGEPQPWPVTVILTLFVGFGLLLVLWEALARATQLFGALARFGRNRLTLGLKWALFIHALFGLVWLALSRIPSS